MKALAWSLGLAISQIFAGVSYAQTEAPAATDKAAARAERKAQGAEAARNFTPGEGNPKPEPKAKVPRADRAAARQARKPEGAAAAKAFEPGEGDPKPEAKSKVSRQDRVAASSARRAQIRAANKAGTLPSYGEGAGDPQRSK